MSTAPAYLTGRPVIWDDEPPAPEPASPPTGVARRAEWLRRGLESLGVQAGDSVVVLCCKRHSEDRLVAVTAVTAMAATPVLAVDWSPSTLGPVMSAHRARSAPATSSAHPRPAVHLACEEGVQAWRAAHGTGVMVGEGEGVLWWRALECRHASPEAG